MVEEEYAKAIYELADENNKIDEYSEYFIALKEVDETPDFINFFDNPTVSKEEKKEVIKKTFKSFDKNFLNFLFVLVDNNRMNYLKKIGKRYTKMVLENKNIIKVRVFSAKTLTKEELNKIKNGLKNRYKDNQIEIKNVIKPELIAGYRVVINNEAIDLSLKNSLDQLKKSL